MYSHLSKPKDSFVSLISMLECFLEWSQALFGACQGCVRGPGPLGTTSSNCHINSDSRSLLAVVRRRRAGVRRSMQILGRLAQHIS
jgi:hypothetical protein